MELQLRPHQEPLYKELQALLISNDTICLALDTGSGKTEIACKYILDNPQQRIVVFAHNQLVLKKNFSDRLTKYGIKHTTSVKDYISGAANVLVTLPAAVFGHLSNLPKADCIVIDECHEYYKDSVTKNKVMYKSILEWHSGTKLLLTASHFELTDVPKIFFSREESLRVGQVADINTKLVSNEIVELKPEDFNKNGDVKESFRFEFMEHPLSIIEPHLDDKPTLLIAPNTGTAISIYKQMLKEGYSVSIDLSRKGYDRQGLALLKEGYVQICVVVNKGILGFDYADLATVIDCSFTQNVQRMVQSKRSGRKSDLYPNKQYIKLAPDNQFEHYRLLTIAAVAIGEYTMYREWDGNTKTVRIPRQYQEDDIIVAGRLCKKVMLDKKISIQQQGVELYSVENPVEDMSNSDIIEHLVDSGQIVKTRSGTKRADPYGKPVPVCQTFESTFKQYVPILGEDNQTTLGQAYFEMKNLRGEGQRSWDKESIHTEALKYSSRSEFQKGCASAYITARNLSILDEVCSHMKAKHKSWDKESIHTEALKYSSRKEFQKGCVSAYDTARNLSILDEVCSHMKAKLKSWDKESIHAEALKYSSRSEFVKGCKSAYQGAVRLSILDEVCSHMIKKRSKK